MRLGQTHSLAALDASLTPYLGARKRSEMGQLSRDGGRWTGTSEVDYQTRGQEPTTLMTMPLVEVVYDPTFETTNFAV